MKKLVTSLSLHFGLLLVLGLQGSFARAGQVTAANAGTDQPANSVPSTQPSTLAGSSSVSEGDDDAVQLHSRRATATRSFAEALALACPAKPLSEETKALLEKALSRAILQKKGLDQLEARRRKLEQDAVQAPRDGRIINALALLVRDRKKLEDAARIEAQGKSVDLAREITALSASLCTELCSGSDTAAAPLNLCAFSSPVLANAAAISDFPAVEGLSRSVRQRILSLTFVLADKSVLTLSDLIAAEPSLSTSLGLMSVEKAASRVTQGEHTGLDLVGFTSGVADIAIRSLANVIVDRARREALVYFIEQLQRDVCGSEHYETEANAAVFREIRTYWLPHTCNLAQKPLDFLQYGGGATLLMAIRGAVAADVREWPGATLGLGLGASLWLSPSVKGSLFACDAAQSNAQTNACALALQMRTLSSSLVSNLARGPNAALSLYHFGTGLDATFNASLAPKELRVSSLRIAACAASLPLLFQEYGPSVREMRPGRAAETEALLLAALTTSPACFSLLGQGFAQTDCPGFSSSPNGPVCRRDPGASLQWAADATTRIEKLSTLLRWSSRISAPASQMGTHWDAVLNAFAAYQNVALAYQSNGQGRLQVLAASGLMAEASLDLSIAFAKAFGSIPEARLLPGLCANGACNPAEFASLLAQSDADLGRIQASLDLLSALLSQDEGQLIARVMTTLRAESKRLCPEGTSSCGPVDRLARHIGLFAALAFETDPNKVAAALDAAAMPVGGFRRKNVPGSFTVTAGAFPGLTIGSELRLGPYGGHDEAMETPYFIAPTLTLPVGVDFAKGYGSYNLGVFVSALDPAAYLQYDALHNGRLPGAQLLTVLSPGVWLRAGLFGSPFTVSAYSVFRPGLRAWESGSASPAAHALQFGLAASVDVSLFDLFTGSAPAP